jgi:hypothetical protein
MPTRKLISFDWAMKKLLRSCLRALTGRDLLDKDSRIQV